MNVTELASVPGIVAVVYFLVNTYKNHVPKTNEVYLKIIPIIAAMLGLALGIVAFYAAKSIMPADNVISAMLVGGASGLAATGTNQILKQLKTDDKAVETKKDGE
jgi:hypothetical protein